jgi:hypothetical protein
MLLRPYFSKLVLLVSALVSSCWLPNAFATWPLTYKWHQDISGSICTKDAQLNCLEFDSAEVLSIGV